MFHWAGYSFQYRGDENFFNDQNSYLWGYYDGSGYEFLKPADYYEEFIYSEDFIHADRSGIMRCEQWNMLENQFELLRTCYSGILFSWF